MGWACWLMTLPHVGSRDRCISEQPCSHSKAEGCRDGWWGQGCRDAKPGKTWQVQVRPPEVSPWHPGKGRRSQLSYSLLCSSGWPKLRAILLPHLPSAVCDYRCELCLASPWMFVFFLSPPQARRPGVGCMIRPPHLLHPQAHSEGTRKKKLSPGLPPSQLGKCPSSVPLPHRPF